LPRSRVSHGGLRRFLRRRFLRLKKSAPVSAPPPAVSAPGSGAVCNTISYCIL
jgi:hypothetical protein